MFKIMSSEIYLIIFISSFFILLMIILGGFRYLYEKIPKYLRLNMDEVPSSLSRLWWLVTFFQHYLVKYISQSWLEKRLKLLSNAGLEYFLTPAESYALQCLGFVGMAAFSLFVGVVADLSLVNIVILTIFSSLLGWFYPMMWMKDQRKRIALEIMKNMPSLLDIMTLCTECGLSLNAAFSNYVEKGPKCKLRSDIERVLRDIRSGASRVEALSKAANRISIPDFSMLVSLIAQCETLGSPLGPTLRKFAEQKRAERFQRAEKLAMEAPLKMMGPLIIFIFPITFIIIGFPIVATVMENIR